MEGLSPVGRNRGRGNCKEIRRLNVELRRERRPDVPAILSLAPDFHASFAPASRIHSYLLREP
jgi:hypothetical protein